MAWRLTSPPIVEKVSVGRCRQLLEMEPVGGEEEIKPCLMKHHQAALDEGQFHPPTLSYCFCRETGRRYRVNGLYVATLFLKQRVMPDLDITVHECECDTLLDLAKLSSTYDHRRSYRTASQIYQFFWQSQSGVPKINRPILDVCAVGLAFHGHKTLFYSASTAEKRGLMLIEHKDFVIWYDRLLKSGLNRYPGPGFGDKRRGFTLTHQAVAAAMFGTRCIAPDEADDFWSKVRDEDGKSPHVPARALAHYLLKRGKTGRAKRLSRKAHTEHLREIYAICVHAWNDYRHGVINCNLQYFDTDPLPLIA
jgi:hypothetical protein